MSADGPGIGPHALASGSDSRPDGHGGTRSIGHGKTGRGSGQVGCREEPLPFHCRESLRFDQSDLGLKLPVSAEIGVAGFISRGRHIRSGNRSQKRGRFDALVSAREITSVNEDVRIVSEGLTDRLEPLTMDALHGPGIEDRVTEIKATFFPVTDEVDRLDIVSAFEHRSDLLDRVTPRFDKINLVGGIKLVREIVGIKSTGRDENNLTCLFGIEISGVVIEALDDLILTAHGCCHLFTRGKIGRSTGQDGRLFLHLGQIVMTLN